MERTARVPTIDNVTCNLCLNLGFLCGKTMLSSYTLKNVGLLIIFLESHLSGCSWCWKKYCWLQRKKVVSKSTFGFLATAAQPCSIWHTASFGLNVAYCKSTVSRVDSIHLCYDLFDPSMWSKGHNSSVCQCMIPDITSMVNKVKLSTEGNKVSKRFGLL